MNRGTDSVGGGEAISPTNLADILIVDDTPANLRVLSGMLKVEGYRTRSATSGAAALAAAESQPPDLILLDVMMPGMNGYEVCARLKSEERLADIPVIFLSALSDTDDKVRAFAVGAADYVTKPFQLDEIHARVETHLRLRRFQIEVERHNLELQALVQEQVREIADSRMATIFALARLAESRDDVTGRHLEHVRTLCRLLAEKMGERGDGAKAIDDVYIENISQAAPLHDVGKVAIHDEILLKPGKLTSSEFAIMKTHTILGAETLQAVLDEYPHNAFIEMGIQIARSHHERWDGTGYPDGLAGDAIPLCARIMAVVDVYDALRSRRCYKKPVPHEKTRDIILGGSGEQFDPNVIDEFRALEAVFEDVWKAAID